MGVGMTLGLILLVAVWALFIVLAFGLCQSAKRGDEMADEWRRQR
jgi:UPF0716 family protein affecting phage T7 exclusion